MNGETEKPMKRKINEKEKFLKEENKNGKNFLKQKKKDFDLLFFIKKKKGRKS